MQNNKTIVGGTFDRFHKGHKALLEKAFEIGQVSIGLTSDKMAKERKKRKVESYEKREASLRFFAQERNRKIEVRRIEDAYGFSLEDDFKNIVVSEETRDMALKINEERKKAGKEPLSIVEIDLVLAKDGKPISSTRIYNNKIDREGNPV